MRGRRRDREALPAPPRDEQRRRSGPQAGPPGGWTVPPLPLARRDAGFLPATPRDERGPPAGPLPSPRRVRLTRGRPAAENGQRRRLSTASSQRRPAGVSYVGSGPFRRSPSILAAFLRSADGENQIGPGAPQTFPCGAAAHYPSEPGRSPDQIASPRAARRLAGGSSSTNRCSGSAGQVPNVPPGTFPRPFGRGGAGRSREPPISRNLDVSTCRFHTLYSRSPGTAPKFGPIWKVFPRRPKSTSIIDNPP